MTTITRRRVLGTAAAATAGFAILTGRAKAAEFSFKIGNPAPPTHPMNLRTQEAADKIKQETGGRMEIQVFGNSQLGGDTDMLSQTRSGALELEQISPLILSTLVPAASINGIGFAFKDYDAVWPAMDGELGAHVRQAIEKAGLVVLDKIWDNGFRQITSSTKPIATPDDLKGFKIRVPVSPLWTSLFKAFGAAPASINFGEVYSALQTRIVDGQENPLALIDTAKLYEVQKYCSLTNHMWDGWWLIANKRMWQSLPADIQEIAARTLNASCLQARQDTAHLNATVQAALQQKGMLINTTETAPFRVTLQQAGFYKEWQGKYGAEAWAILAKYAPGLG